jgi:hypothetical protein
MATGSTRAEIVTFKADKSLLDSLAGIPNRSEFIRSAVLAALENLCPLCKGRGLLTPNQKNHWQAFAKDHGFQECDDCHERHLVCPTGPRSDVHRTSRRTPNRMT